MSTHTRLKGVSSTYQPLLSDQLESNFKVFLDYGLLGIGGFFNVERSESGSYGADLSQLRPVSDYGISSGLVWEGFRKDWVWETGVGYLLEPIRVSGVYINSVFLPLSSGVIVDYPNGRVTLPSAVSTTSTVQCSFSYRLVQVATADSPVWARVQSRSFRPDSPEFAQWGSGAWDMHPLSRAQLPCVIVEAAGYGARRGLEVGGGSIIATQDVVLHVLAEDRWYLKWLYDLGMNQWGKRLRAFDKKSLLETEAFPLDYQGSPRASGLMYPDMVKPTGEGGHYWAQIRVAEVFGQAGELLNGIHYSSVRLRCETDVPASD